MSKKHCRAGVQDRSRSAVKREHGRFLDSQESIAGGNQDRLREIEKVRSEGKMRPLSFRA